MKFPDSRINPQELRAPAKGVVAAVPSLIFAGALLVLFGGCEPDEENQDDSQQGSGGEENSPSMHGGAGGEQEEGSGGSQGSNSSSTLLIPRSSTLTLEEIPNPPTQDPYFKGARARRMKLDGVWTGLVNRFSLIDLDPPEPSCADNEGGFKECTWLVELPGKTYTFVSSELAANLVAWQVYVEGGVPHVDKFMQISGTITDDLGAFEIFSLNPEHHEDVESEFAWTIVDGVEDVNVLTFNTENFSEEDNFERLTVDSSSGKAEFQSTYYYSDPIETQLVRWNVGDDSGEYSTDAGLSWTPFGE